MNNNGVGKVKIVIADDHPLLRQALREALCKEPDFEVTAEASDGDEAVRLAIELTPDVVIIDIGMPKLNGIIATRQIKASCPQIAILVLTVHDDSQHILGILEAGAAGYLTKSVYGKEVVHAVRALVAGETVLSPSISQRIIKHALQHFTTPVPVGRGEKITPREIEILRLAAAGMSNKDIALKLSLSIRTVKGYLAEIFSKLNVSSRTEAVISALRLGLITDDNLK